MDLSLNPTRNTFLSLKIHDYIVAAAIPPSALDERDNQPLKPADGAITFPESSVPSTTRIENSEHVRYWIQDVFREVFFVSEA